MKTIFELIDEGDSDRIRALLVADPAARDTRNDDGLSPLLYAAYKGGPAFDAILEAGEPTDPWDRLIGGYADGLPAPDAWSPDGSFTSLHLAAFVDNGPAASGLLAAGADPNVLAKASYARVTPLGTCAFAGALDVARVLLDHGADPHIGEDGKYTVEAEAIARGNEELAKLIRDAAARSVAS